MKIAVVNTSAPFVRGGAEHLADSLLRAIERHGHQAEHVKVPLRWSTPSAIAESMLAAASLRIPEADRVIALKFPGYLIPHPNKVIWLLHQFRQVYELWGTPLQGLPDGAESSALRRAIRAADERAFSEAKAVYCNSAVTARRLQRYNGVRGSVMLAPHGDATAFRSGPVGDYILSFGRITSAKRQYLLVEALQYAGSRTKIVIAGAPEAPEDLQRLRDEVDRLGIGPRVELIPRFVTDEEKVALLSNARAVAYLPVDEDSYGYITAEAMLSGKPVITCADSGGILELVEDGRTGLVCDPNAQSLGEAIGRLSRDVHLVEALGRAARERIEQLDLSWDRTVERLLA